MLTFAKLFGLGIFLALVIGVGRVFAGKVLNMDHVLVEAGLWIALIILTVASVRRLGILNYFEAILVAVVWWVMSMLVDKFLTNALLQLSVFRRWETWVGYLVMMLSIFLFHKKRHVAIRKELAKKK